MRLQGKKALITGGNSGIGLATAKLFIDEGAEVAITGRNQQTLDEAVAFLGPKAHAFRLEITDSAARKQVFEQIAQRLGKLDIVFANAGVPGNTPAGSASEELFRRIIDTNLTSVFFTVEDSLPYINDGASIILNGSVIGTLGQPGYAAYAAYQGRSSSIGLRSRRRPLPAWYPRQRRRSRSHEDSHMVPQCLPHRRAGLRSRCSTLEDHSSRPHGRGRRDRQGRSLPRLRRLVLRSGSGALRRRWPVRNPFGSSVARG